jgi:hypothetical protein
MLDLSGDLGILRLHIPGQFSPLFFPVGTKLTHYRRMKSLDSKEKVK